MSAATTRSGTPRTPRATRTPDRLCAEAVDLAREAAEEAAAPGIVGAHVEVVAEGDRVVTHYFESKEPGYRGWRWAVTVTRASRAKNVTLDETVLLPGTDALLAPEWVPWSERLRPGDMGPGDLLPPSRTTCAWSPATPARTRPRRTPPSRRRWRTTSTRRTPSSPPAPVARRHRRRRRRTRHAPGPGPLRYGLHIAADRWDEAFGARTPMAQAAPASCESCAFLVPLAGSLKQAFGLCANEFSPADGRVVSLAYGCGGHSEAAVMPKPPAPPPVLDSMATDAFPSAPPRTPAPPPNPTRHRKTWATRSPCAGPVLLTKRAPARGHRAAPRPVAASPPPPPPGHPSAPPQPRNPRSGR
ncbi:DUF3027 domain-containing protein [Streptomyces diastatochromogenes]|nr:DUF3027 domain-containing protein [Streptomyces diastatochromogenes]